MAVNGQRLHYEGVLEKAGKRFFEGFRRRWFILDGKNLSYYRAAETTPENLLGIIDLTKVKAVVPFKMINNNAFQIITSMRTYTFTAATPQLMTEWISVLRQAMQIESFTGSRRGKNSVRRTSSEDDSGYELVSRGSSNASDQATGDDDLYDQISSTSTSKENPPLGTYESVGSTKRTSSAKKAQQLEDYDTVSPSPVKTKPPNNFPGDLGSYGVIGKQQSEDYDIVIPSPVKSKPPSNVPGDLASYGVIGNQQSEDYDTVSPPPVKSKPPRNVPSDQASYGVVGEPRVQPPANVPEMYATVDKRRSSTEEITKETEEAMYAEVGTVEPKQLKIPEISAMPIICESDDDEEEEEDENDEAFVEENLEDIQDPLPPPKGESYAVDQIKLLLKDFKRDDSVKTKRENIDDITESTAVPETCEKAFVRLREFLSQLESK